MTPTLWIPFASIAAAWLAWFLKDRSDRARDAREKLTSLYADFLGLASRLLLETAAKPQMDFEHGYKLMRLRSELAIVEQNPRLRQLVEEVMSVALGGPEKRTYLPIKNLEEAVRERIARI